MRSQRGRHWDHEDLDVLSEASDFFPNVVQTNRVHINFVTLGLLQIPGSWFIYCTTWALGITWFFTRTMKIHTKGGTRLPHLWRPSSPQDPTEHTVIRLKFRAWARGGRLGTVGTQTRPHSEQKQGREMLLSGKNLEACSAHCDVTTLPPCRQARYRIARWKRRHPDTGHTPQREL